MDPTKQVIQGNPPPWIGRRISDEIIGWNEKENLTEGWISSLPKRNETGKH